MSTKPFDRKKLMKDIAREEKKTARQRLELLRAQLKDARLARKKALSDATRRCKEARQAIAEKLRIVKSVLKSIKSEKVSARSTCSTGIHEARTLRAHVDLAKNALLEEEKHQRAMRRIESGNRKRRREEPKTTARERHSESEHEVLVNIPAELVPLWHRVKGHIHATERMSRTEVFLKYAEEHPDEYLESIDDKTEAMIRELEAKERAAMQDVAREEAPFYRYR